MKSRSINTQAKKKKTRRQDSSICPHHNLISYVNAFWVGQAIFKHFLKLGNFKVISPQRNLELVHVIQYQIVNFSTCVHYTNLKDSCTFTFLLQCSTQPCDSVEWANKDDVTSFQNAYGQVDDEYRCYYNPKTPDEAFKNRSSVKSDNVKIVNCILWPMLLIGISIGLLGTLFLRSKGLCCVKNRSRSSVPYQDLQPTA